MGFDLVAFLEATPGTGLQGITRALNDHRYVETTGDNIRIKTEAPYLAGVYYADVSDPDETRLRQTSRLQDLEFYQSCDLNDPDFYPGFSNFLTNPIKLRAREMATCLAESAADDCVAVGWILTPGAFIKPPKIAPTHIIHAEEDLTLTTLQWGQFPTPTWSQSLPDGLYYIIGMKASAYISSGFQLGFARLILDKISYRPGVPLAQGEGDKQMRMSAVPNPQERWGLQRDLCFHSKSMPGIEACSIAALTDFKIELAVVAADKVDVGNVRPD